MNIIKFKVLVLFYYERENVNDNKCISSRISPRLTTFLINFYAFKSRAFFMLNETKLFISVIVQGLLDALNLFYDDRKINSKHHREATYWLVHKDFKYVCDLADLHPDYVLFVYTQLKEQDQNITYDQTKEILYETFTRQQ